MEDLAMAKPVSWDSDWSEGWGVVKQIDEELQFIAFFDAREDAEAAAAEAGVDCQVCWLTHKLGLRLPAERDKRFPTPRKDSQN
jgi:hypothetical protein